MSETQKQPETTIDNNQETVFTPDDTPETEDSLETLSLENNQVEKEIKKVKLDQEINGAQENEATAPTEEETETEVEENPPRLDELELVIDTLQQENAALKNKLEEQIRQTDQFKAQFVRNAADFENFRKRTEKEKEELEYQVKRKTLTELLAVIDNFERARSQIKPATEGETTIHKSYQGVYRLLVDSLKRIGVSAMKPEGELFDPNFHEAVMQQETNEYPEGTVMEQFQRGYLLGDRVLRHAMVKVATPAEEGESPAPSGSEETPTPNTPEETTTTDD
jgi:molecular chaperone GrpE